MTKLVGFGLPLTTGEYLRADCSVMRKDTSSDMGGQDILSPQLIRCKRLLFRAVVAEERARALRC